jgi:hypothetical protein
MTGSTIGLDQVSSTTAAVSGTGLFNAVTTHGS